MTAPLPIPTEAPVQVTSTPDPAAADALRAILARPGAACPHCGYSLAGLAQSAATPDRCPECGGGIAAGLVRSTGPTRLRRVMTLMFAWLAFAGCMNATRWGLSIYDIFLRPQAVGNGGWTIYTPYSATTAAGATGLSAVPRQWWLELGGWSILGILGIGGAIAVALMRSGDANREKRLVFLLVLGFIGYWGYHGFQFALELFPRL